MSHLRRTWEPEEAAMTPPADSPWTAAGRALHDWWHQIGLLMLDAAQEHDHPVGCNFLPMVLAIEAEAVGMGGETALRLHASVHKVQDRERAEAATPPASDTGLRAALERGYYAGYRAAVYDYGGNVNVEDGLIRDLAGGYALAAQPAEGGE